MVNAKKAKLGHKFALDHLDSFGLNLGRDTNVPFNVLELVTRTK
jgi:hypothetical protein